MKRTILFIVVLVLGISTHGQTLFDWETAYFEGGGGVNGDIIEEKNDIIVRVRDESSSNWSQDIKHLPNHFDSPSSGNVILFNGFEVTFDFNQSVDVNSILVIDRSGHKDRTWDCIFIPTGGSNAPVVVRLDTWATVNFDWTGVTSIKVVGANFDPIKGENGFDHVASFVFDDLSVDATSLGVDDVDRLQKITVYPNPAVNLLHIKNYTGLNSMKLYNGLGQLVKQTRKEYMDIRHLAKGMYVLKIKTDQGIETRKILKK